ncbi:hypothetical protein CHS0354_036260 [Potamilus streckersoni]|uniref:Uncharacterized protein n=1 Tax=Potamilus streckersoni TaxID=2493646 RepID=A0AAE0SWQ3_9BIVA|nr:hypothetical protein CHS0354_036260 [Potamilus streckersoni]
MSNKVCHLLDPLFNSVSFYKLSVTPNHLCVVGQSEIAVSSLCLWVQFLSVRDNVITPTREVITQHECSGLAIVSQAEMIVTGSSDNYKKYYWSLVTLDGKEKS